MRPATWAIALAAIAGLGGCTHYVPLVMPTLKCPIPPGLMQACARPQTLADGLSFGDLVRSYQLDRQNLMLCSQQQESVRAAVEACNLQIDQYNDALGKLNPGTAPK